MERKKTFLVNIAFYGIIAALIVIVFKYGMRYILPFLLAFIFAFALNEPIRWLSTKAKFSRRLSSIIIVSMAILILSALVILVGAKTAGRLKALFSALPLFYKEQIEPYLQRLAHWYEEIDFIRDLGPTIGSILESTAESIMSTLGSLVTTFSVKIVSWLTSVVTSFPSNLMNFLITVIAVYFIAGDYDNIMGFLERQFKPRTVEFIKYIKVNFFDTIGKYLISYLLILLITFGETSVLMIIARVVNPFFIAFLISIFDFLPIVGISTIFIPWIVIDLMYGNYVRAIIIAVGWIAMMVVRNIIEPKIVGTKVGMHPLVALIAMFVGLKLGGLLGMFIIPIGIVMLTQMQQADIIMFYKE